MTDQANRPTRKLSRQQLRAQMREKHDANGWITALKIDDPWMMRAIRSALGNRHVTRTELEEAIGVSLTTSAPVEPERIAVQHILISFAGAGTAATRTRDEAETLAHEVLTRARQGEAFDGLVRSVTDDSFPGIYRLCNTGIQPHAADEHARDRMVPAFGDVGFPLDVDEIAMASHDPRTSPYGWHIIKRLE